jgi:hypothetical protein
LVKNFNLKRFVYVLEKFVLNTPVAFLIFNRPETTARVFDEIRKSKPKKLFVVADGPRESKAGEKEKCLEARAIIERVDWDCDIKKNYSDVNLGCKHRISSGISWVFENTEEAIFLEDDCLPHQSFFRYCQELLEYYRNDERVMMISGNNFQNKKVTDCSYYFSAYSHIWGWASWKRAWNYYDLSMKDWPGLKSEDFLLKILNNKKAVKYWEIIMQETYDGEINTWDYQWLYSCWKKNGLTVIPEVNLVSNIGFGANASHTTGSSPGIANMRIEGIKFPLKHPDRVERNISADKYEVENFHLFGKKEKIRRLLKKFKIVI